MRQSLNNTRGLIDTHCHIHEDDYPLDADGVWLAAKEAGIVGLICVGTNNLSSRRAIDFAGANKHVWATVGLHPHDAKKQTEMEGMEALASDPKVVAIGECGLDYYYDFSPQEIQRKVLEQHFEIAKSLGLAMTFHIRGKMPDSSDAYEDFWEIYDRYKLPGVIHSFSAHSKQLGEVLERDLYLGVNGISTFVKPGPQMEAYKAIPLDKLLLETDSPLLTPEPNRGQVNQPRNTVLILERLSELLSIDGTEMSRMSTRNAINLFGLKLD